MPWSFIVPAAVSLFGASKQASAAKDAAATTAAATDQATQLQREMYQQTREDQAPYRAAGTNALAEMQRTAGNVPGAFKFGMGEFNADPGYGFRLAEGQKALDRSAAARGGLISGGALKAATRYGQDMGSQEYQNAFNRALTGYNTGVASENQLYNRQAAMAGIGQTAANFTNAAGQNYGTNVGNALVNQGANAGNARMAGASAYGSALSGIGSAYGRNPVSFSSLYGGNTSSGSAGNPLAVGEYADPGYWT
jgi:Sec-independent protein translocase protein TatA